MILLWRSLMNRPKMKKMVTMKKTRMMRKKKRIQKMKNPRRRKLFLSPKKLQPSLKRKLQQIVTQALDQSTIPEVAPMMRRRKFQVMAAEVIMNLMNPSKLEEEPRARRRPPKETVMAIVAARSGEAKRRDPRAEKRKTAVTTRTATTKSQKKKGSKGRKKKNSSDDEDSDYEKPKAKKGKKGGGNGYTAPVKLSEELADIVGGDEMPRHEVVKRMWAYIKDNKLQDPK